MPLDLRLPVCPVLLLFPMSGFSHFGPNFKPQILRSRSCLIFCSSPPGPHISLWRFPRSNRLQYVFLQNIQICKSSSGHVNVFQRNRECFFTRHIELNSRFIVMTVDEVTLDRPEVFPGFSAISRFCRLRLSDSP